MNNNKKLLDSILKENKAEPVGWGYIDVIVSRENYKQFVTDLIQNDFKIEAIGWWEWCPKDNVNTYGMGGPKSKFYDGWFAEMGIDLDRIKTQEGISKEETTKIIIDTIESKTFDYPSKKIKFKEDEWLTPALWIQVPKDWRNEL